MNINTPKFWDKQFKEEYAFYKKNKELKTTCDWRWNGQKFGKIGWDIGFKGSLLDTGCRKTDLLILVCTSKLR